MKLRTQIITSGRPRAAPAGGRSAVGCRLAWKSHSSLLTISTIYVPCIPSLSSTSISLVRTMATPAYIGFVGCYTKPGQADPFESSHGGIPHDRSKVGTGVHAISIDAEGKLTLLNGGEPIIKADDLPNPSYLTILGRGHGRSDALSNGGLCVVSELGEGKCHFFSVRCGRTSKLSVEATVVGNAVSTGGSYPCHVTESNLEGPWGCIFVCNYGEDEGVLSILSIDRTPHVEQSCIRFGPGSKADLVRQQSSHAHSTCALNPLESSSSLLDLCAADLGSDSIIQFSISKKVNSENVVSLLCVEKGRLATPSGSGPRSLMFNPSPSFSNIAIVSLEMTAQVWLIRRRLHDGCLEGLCSPISVLPENWPDRGGEGGIEATEMQFNRGRWASDAVWSPDGKFCYAAARLHDSISVFRLQYKFDKYRQSQSTQSVSPNSVIVQGLELVDRIPTHGRTPRCLEMSECGKFVLVAHQHSHDVSSFKRNERNGKLTFVNKLDVNCAACVKLVRPEKIG